MMIEVLIPVYPMLAQALVSRGLVWEDTNRFSGSKEQLSLALKYLKERNIQARYFK